MTGPGRNDAGPPTCIVVIGVGRSGTSATSGLLVKLGLAPPRPDDLVPAASSNELGHWESRTLIRCNAQLLRAVGRTAYGPPEVRSTWKDVEGYDDVKATAEAWFSSTYEGRPLALKDPRMCLTLPFWRDVLPAPVAALLVVRDPIQNARSRQARDGTPMTLGLAIWDRHQRSALAGLEGLPTLVVEFDSMLAKPGQTCTDVVGFLRQRGIEVSAQAEDDASTWLDASLRHQKDRVDDYSEMAEVQEGIFTQLSTLTGVHDAWRSPDLPPAPPWVDDVIQVRHGQDKLRQELLTLKGSRTFRFTSAMRKAADRLPGT
jgi:hypothetical protein